MIIDDNLDQNSSSLSGTQHFHGSSVTVLQFPTIAEPGLEKVRPSYEALLDEVKVPDLSIVDYFTEVSDSNYNVKNAVCPITTVCVPEQFVENVKDIFEMGIKDELDWAKKH